MGFCKPASIPQDGFQIIQIVINLTHDKQKYLIFYLTYL